VTNTARASSVSPGPSPRAALCEAIQQNADLLASYLPAHVPRAQYLALATRAVIDNPDIWDCSPQSVLKAIAAGGSSGLPIDGKMSSLIVRRSKHGKPVCSWDPSYRGMCYLALESGHVTSIEAHAVFQRDEFSVELGTAAAIVHRPYLAGDRGPVVASYAVATLKAGGQVREILGADDLRKIRASSPAGDRGPWASWPERMAMKSAMRRLLKALPAADSGTLERARQHVLEQDAGADGSFRASLELPEKRPAKPEDTTDLEARAIAAISEAATPDQLADVWSGIRAEFRELEADLSLAIEARYHDRREALSQGAR
jgi:recombination protein RecT